MAIHQSSTSALIPFAVRQLGSATVNTVNARDLHAFLGPKARFNDWITRRIAAYGFEEGRDFTVLKNEYQQNQYVIDDTNNTIEYHVSLAMAKELSMVERTKKGKEARLYFLACEQRALEAESPPLPTVTPGEVALALAQAVVTIERRQLAMEARQDAQDATIAALQAERPPLGKFSCVDWLKRMGKPFLPTTMLSNFKAGCKRRERPERFRPASSQYEQLYYDPATLEAAYAETMYQMLLFPSTERRRG